MSYNYKIYGQIKLFFDGREIACKVFNTKVQRNRIMATWQRSLLSKKSRTNAYYQIMLFDEEITHVTKRLERVYEKKKPTMKRPPAIYSNQNWD